MLFGRQRLQQNQDQHIQQIHGMAVKMKNTGQELSNQLQRQDRLVGQLDREMDLTTGKLQGLQGQLGELLQTNDINQVCTVLMMFAMTIILINLVIFI